MAEKIIAHKLDHKFCELSDKNKPCKNLAQFIIRVREYEDVYNNIYVCEKHLNKLKDKTEIIYSGTGNFVIPVQNWKYSEDEKLLYRTTSLLKVSQASPRIGAEKKINSVGKFDLIYFLGVIVGDHYLLSKTESIIANQYHKKVLKGTKLITYRISYLDDIYEYVTLENGEVIEKRKV